MIAGMLLLGCVTLKAQEKKKKLRELSPDRPHQTESPHTVDVGHIMFETDVVNTTFYHNTVPHSATTGLFYFNLKAGIQKNMDVEVLSNALSFTRYEHQALPPTHTAFPDLTFRYKLNVLGNDSGRTSIAIMPFVTTSNFFADKWQAKTGGLFVNAEHLFGEKYEIGYTGGLTSFSIRPFFQTYELFSTVSFSYPLYKSLDHFVEVSERFNRFSEGIRPIFSGSEWISDATSFRTCSPGSNQSLIFSSHGAPRF